MIKKKYKYFYGPVPSWRLGSSLGVDPLSDKKKICSFDCVYCQIGKTTVNTKQRKVFVPTECLIEELRSLPPLDIDYITFAGRGEPTLAENLGEMISEVKKVKKAPIAVLTNSSLLYDKKVREDLSRADFVVAKIDAASEAMFRKMNKPVQGLGLIRVIEGIEKFLSETSGKLALQIMFVSHNEKEAQDIAKLAKKLNVDEIQLNTPLRPSAVKPLSIDQMKKIEGYFKGLNAISVYKSTPKKVKPISSEETLKRRGKV